MAPSKWVNTITIIQTSLSLLLSVSFVMQSISIHIQNTVASNPIPKKRITLKKGSAIQSNIPSPHSFLKASVGFIFAALLAGYTPATSPTKTETIKPAAILDNGNATGKPIKLSAI